MVRLTIGVLCFSVILSVLVLGVSAVLMCGFLIYSGCFRNGPFY